MGKSASDRLKFVHGSMTGIPETKGGTFRNGSWDRDEVGILLSPEFTQVDLTASTESFIELCEKYGGEEKMEEVDKADIIHVSKFAKNFPHMFSHLNKKRAVIFGDPKLRGELSDIDWKDPVHKWMYKTMRIVSPDIWECFAMRQSNLLNALSMLCMYLLLDLEEKYVGDDSDLDRLEMGNT
ncbi:hypothetical protein HK098_006897 [Nowakowskiella sp. JEL0407]|nr:hypothetical protein HK098_006897 [Nowakowskiella sp. JEL0407]